MPSFPSRDSLPTICRALVSFLALLASVPGHAARSVEYYANLSFWESPVQVLRPESPISAAEASTRTHFRVLRDEQARITEISYRLGTQVKDIEGFAGNLYLNAPVTRIQYQGATETHTFFNRLGHPMEASGRSRSVYQLDRFGRYERLHFENSKGERTANGWGVQEYRWDYPADGSVIEERVDAKGVGLVHRGGFEFMRIRMVFDPRGHLSLMQNIDAADAPVNARSGAAQYRYFYDRLGRFIRWEVLDAAGKPALGPTRTAGEENHYRGQDLASIVFFGPQQEPILHDSGAARWHFQRDRFGNVTQLSYTGLNGEKVANKYGVGQMRYHYTRDGMFLTGMSHHDVDGQLIKEPEFGFAQTRITRDARGLIRKLAYLDEQGRQVNRRDSGVAYQTYAYNRQGVRTAVHRFDAAGRPVAAP